jgi:hypothetical protein
MRVQDVVSGGRRMENPTLINAASGIGFAVDQAPQFFDVDGHKG